MTWSSSEKKLKNDEGERKYHIIRKMHAFHVFPKTDYLTSMFFFFFFEKLNKGAGGNQNFFFTA